MKLQEYLELEGWDSLEQALEAYILDSVCPCICKNPDCDYYEELEPDQTEGWCPECNEGSLVSIMVLAGVI